MKTVLAVTLSCLAGTALLLAATIGKIDLTDGYDENNRIVAPVYDAASAVSLEILPLASPANTKAKFVRRTGSGMWAKAPEYDLARSVDLGALLTDALRSESSAMGFKKGGDGVWQVGGTLKDIYLESRQIFAGATLFYGFMQVELQVKSPSGESQTTVLRLHNYFGGYNAGFGRRDEAESGAAHLLVEGAQEILARLNRVRFKAQAHADMARKLEGLATGNLGRGSDLRMIGLSGLPAAGPRLLELLPTQTEEDRRSAIIDALAVLGSAEAVDALAARYAKEDEDCRWYTLKAMDYIGGPEAERLVSSQGVRDPEMGPKRLAGRITGTGPQ